MRRKKEGLARNLHQYAIIKDMKNSILPILRVAIILLLAGVVFGIVFFQEKRGKEEPAKKTTRELREFTEEEKIKLLESLSAPEGAPQYTDEEKRKILESLSAPKDQPALTEEEKIKILESLSAPQ